MHPSLGAKIGEGATAEVYAFAPGQVVKLFKAGILGRIGRGRDRRKGVLSMRFGELKSIGHNIADSLASGVCLLIGLRQIDVFSEASGSAEKFILVDFLAGTTDGADPSKELASAVSLYRDALGDLCRRHGVEASAFKTLTARYGVDRVYGPYFTVTVEDQMGRRSVDHYGVGGRRLIRE
mgnify:CR=1 FL=1